MGRMRRKASFAAAVAVGVVGMAVMVWGASALLADREAHQSFTELSESTVSDAPAQGRDWGALLAEQPETCAWLTVAGTSVDVPVMRATSDDPERWLYRGLDGGHSDVGTPYLDYRCSPDGRVMVVYGHRTLYESYLFHDLSGVYEQTAFDGLADASWETPSAGVATLEPLCAASVDMADEEWHRYAFAGVSDMREWLSWAVGASSARAEGADELAASATRALVLVTCNGALLYPSTRTVTVFVCEGGQG